MAELVLGGSRVVTQSSLVVSKFGFRTCATPARSLHLLRFSGNRQHFKRIGVVSSESAPTRTIFSNNVDLSSEGIEVQIEPDIGGGGDDGLSNTGGDGGGGGGGGDGGGGGGGGDGGESSEDSEGDRKKKMSMSQKLTLGYAALVGLGGVMGYMKSGSQKSLLSGGFSAAVLYYVFTKLPSDPVFASTIGLGVSAALLAVMATRFSKSKKVFPAGVVALVSLVMSGGYVHGIMRSMH